jgi:hypothetical protein
MSAAGCAAGRGIRGANHTSHKTSNAGACCSPACALCRWLYDCQRWCQPRAVTCMLLHRGRDRRATVLHTARPSMPVYARLCPSMPVYARLCPSMPVHARPCPSMPVYARLCPSMPVYARPCPSMPVYARLCPSMPGDCACVERRHCSDANRPSWCAVPSTDSLGTRSQIGLPPGIQSKWGNANAAWPTVPPPRILHTAHDAHPPRPYDARCMALARQAQRRRRRSTVSAFLRASTARPARRARSLSSLTRTAPSSQAGKGSEVPCGLPTATRTTPVTDGSSLVVLGNERAA